MNPQVVTDAFESGIQCCSQNYSRRLSEEVAYPACKPMDVPVNDPFYSQFEANCMNFISSQITFSNECKIGSAEKVQPFSIKRHEMKLHLTKAQCVVKYSYCIYGSFDYLR